VGHKTVTELEWRCCPGYSGEHCHDGSTPLPDGTLPPSNGGGGAPPHRPGLRGYPHGPKPTVDHRPGVGQIEPGRPLPNTPGGEDVVRMLSKRFIQYIHIAYACLAVQYATEVQYCQK